MTPAELSVASELGRDGPEAATAVLVSAFLDDPTWTSRLPQRTKRRAVLLSAIGALTQDAGKRGRLLVARSGNEALGAAAVWAPGDHPRPWRSEFLRAAVTIAAETGVGSVSLARRYAALRRVDSRFPVHWHLAIIGVRPDVQHQQVGSRLVAEFLKRVDATGTAAYLETTRPELVGWYGRFGFELHEHVTLPGPGQVTILWREPVQRTGSKAQPAAEPE